MKRPAAAIQETEQAPDEEMNDMGDDADTAALKKPAGVLKRPAAAEETEQAQDEEPDAVDESETAVVTKKPAGVLKKPAAAETTDELQDEEEEEDEVIDEVDPAVVTKKPAAKKARTEDDGENESSVLKKPAAVLKKPAAAEEGELADPGEGVIKKPAAAEEAGSKVDVVSRKKELKSMAASELKDLVLSKGLESTNRNANVEAILALEATEREAAAKRIENAKQIIASFKKELAAKSASELGEACQQKGLKKGGDKNEKVERLFAHAKETGDIARAIAASEREQRKEQLSTMDKSALYNLCTKEGIDPLNKEVMIDRIIAHESGK